MSRYADYQYLKVEVQDKLATVTLNRPEARNAINQRFIHELREIWVDLADDHAVNAVLLTGAGKYFSVGGDVKAMSERPGGDVLERRSPRPMVMRRIVNRLLELDKPIVCAINGDAVIWRRPSRCYATTVAAETAHRRSARQGRPVADGGAAIALVAFPAREISDADDAELQGG
jgi:1,4-dihydroxy-2-naphthoyl-CoA synthase